MIGKRIVLLVGLALATAAFAAQEGALMRRKIEANTSDTYKVETKVKQVVTLAAMGDQDMSMNTESTMVLKYGKVDENAGTAELETVFTVDKMDSEGAMGAMMGTEKPAPMTLKGKIDVRNRITLAASTPENPMSAMLGGGGGSLQSGFLVELPEKPVKIGDSWDIVIPKNPFTSGEDQKMTATLTGEKKEGDKDCWIVSVKGIIKTDVDTSKLPKDPKAATSGNPMADMKMLIKGTVDVTGQGLVDKATGKTISMGSTAKTKITVELPDNGVTADTNGTVTTTVTLKG